MKRPSSFPTRGSTLMLALWALIILSAIVFAWVERIDREIDAVQAANRSLEARAMAHSGLAVGLHPAIAINSPNLENRFDGDRSYQVTIESEGGRINLNYLLAGEDPAKIRFLKEYLAQRGLTLQECDRLIDCLLDWTTSDSGKRRLNSVPEGPDYHPPHRPLQNLEELALVAGSRPLISQAGWKDDLTLYSNGPLDLESAPADLLALIPGISIQRAQQFVQEREKRLAESPDGHPFKDVPEALRYLGLTQNQFAQVSPFLAFRDPVQRVRSVGQAGTFTHEVEVVAQKNGGAPQILLWQEK